MGTPTSLKDSPALASLKVSCLQRRLHVRVLKKQLLCLLSPPWADSTAVTQAGQACRQAGKVEAERPCLCWLQAQAPPALDSLLLESRKLEDSRQNMLYQKPEPSAKLGGQWWQVDRDHMGLRQLIRTAHLGRHHTLCPRQTQAGLWLLLQEPYLLSPVPSLLRPRVCSVCPLSMSISACHSGTTRRCEHG